MFNPGRIYVIRSHLSKTVSEQTNMSIPLSTHILDTSIGKPAKNVEVALYKMTDSDWKLIDKKKTNEDGRCSGFIDTEPFASGLYKLHFSVEEYFKFRSVDSIYPYVEVVFKMDSQNYHIPLLLNPYGYSTYKGS